MAERNKFQTDVATGRFTFPVAILLCLFLRIVTLQQWQDAISLLACSLTAYLLIEINTAFTLIRTRTTLHVCFYFYLSSVCFFLHPWHSTTFAPLFFLVALSQLFRSYESAHAPVHIFHSFFFIGLCSLLFPQILYVTPLFYLSMISFRALSLKSFFAGIIGLALPYWLFFGYAFYYDRLETFHHLLAEAIRFQPISYGALTRQQLVSGGIITLLSLTASIHYFHTSYLDKVRTRIFLSFLIAIEIWIYLLALLQPQHFNVLLHIQIILNSIFCGHLFTLTRNRFSGILFTATFVILIVLTTYNLWMQFFNS